MTFSRENVTISWQKRTTMHKHMKRATIIVAGGSGVRMGGDLPKQFLKVGNKPILLHTLETFHRFDPHMCIVIVLPASQLDYWKNLLTQYQCTIPHMVATGGNTRFESVKNGIRLIPSDTQLIGVHDGVRPFVSNDTLMRCYSNEKTAIIPVIPLHDSIRQLTENSNIAADRSAYVAVQTPQVFHADLLRKAYTLPYEVHFTDDASVVEAAGGIIELTEGNRENIKITTPFDLLIAESLLRSKQP